MNAALCVACATLALALAPMGATAQFGSQAEGNPQNSGSGGQVSLEVPHVDSTSSEWDSTFTSIDQRRNFKMLREFRAEKQAYLNELQSQTTVFRLLNSKASEMLKRAARARAILEQYVPDTVKATDRVELPSLSVEDDYIIELSTPTTLLASDIRSRIQRFAASETAAKAQAAEIQAADARLTASISNVSRDLRQVELAIEQALAPEYEELDFRKVISGFFALLIGIMIISFFAVIYRKAGDTVGSLLLSDGGLQFITIFVLIIAIILFGVLKILEGRELAAILSGIAGYILGRGSQVKQDAAQGNQPDPIRQPAVEPAVQSPPPGVLPPITGIRNAKGVPTPGEQPPAASAENRDDPPVAAGGSPDGRKEED